MNYLKSLAFIASLMTCFVCAAASETTDSIRVLSINNSLIYCNNQDAMFNDIATSQGKPAKWTKHTRLGKTLEYHFNDTTATPARNIVAAGNWDYIILQEQSSRPRTNFDIFRTSVGQWIEYIDSVCPGAKVILALNWGYDENDWTNFIAQNELLHANYEAVAAEYGLTVCPVGDAYQLFFVTEGPDAMHSFFNDNMHPTFKASYLAALLEYATIFGTDPRTVSVKPERLDEADAAAMRALAAKTLGL